MGAQVVSGSVPLWQEVSSCSCVPLAPLLPFPTPLLHS